MEEKQINVMKLDYAWDLWKLDYRKSLRKKILQTDEETKVKIAKELGLEYPFLLKRQVHLGFRNLIYYKIISNKKHYRKILAELTKIISNYIIDQEEIERILSGEGLWAELKMPYDTFRERRNKDMSNQVKRVIFMENLLKHKLILGDLEDVLLISAELNELTATRSYTRSIAPFFAERVISHNIDAHKKYDYTMRAYATLKLKNYRRYVNFGEEIAPHLQGMKEILGQSIKLKIINQVFSVFEIEKTPEMYLHYHKFIQNLLTIGSWIFFNTLDLKEKLEVLNREFGVKDFINFIIHHNISIDKSVWSLLIDTLSDNKYFQEALNLMEYFRKTLFLSFNRFEKGEFYHALGRLYYFLRKYDKAIENNSRFIELLKDQENADQKIIHALIIIGESHAHLGDQDKMEENFNEAIKIGGNLDNPQKFFINYYISLSYRQLGQFKQEQEHLAKAADLISEKITMNYLNYIDLRSTAFLETEMSPSKLKESENIQQAQLYFDLGKSAQQCFYHRESANFLKKCLTYLESTKEDQFKFLAWKNLGFTSFLLRDWEEMENSFDKALSIKNEDYLSILYFSLALFISGKLDLAKLMLSKACKLAKDNEEKIKWGLENIALDFINSIGRERFLEFISLLENVEEDERWDLIYNFGNILANYGFAEIGVILFKKELEITKDTNIKAKYYNNIGTVYSDTNEFGQAFEFFEKAVALNPEFAFCYRNMAQTYVRMSEFAKAVTLFKKAIEVAQINRDEENASFYRGELNALQIKLKHSLLIDKIPDDDIKKLMLTAEMLYLNFWRSQSTLDASLILIEYGKSLEAMLHIYVSPIFQDLIRKQKSHFFNKSLSIDVRKKFGNLFYKKSIGLGDWVRILKAFKKPITDKELKEYKDCLVAKFNDVELEVIHNACKYMVKERNPSSHIKIHNIEYVIALRMKIIELLNNVIETIF